MLRAKLEELLVYKVFPPDYTKALCVTEVEGRSNTQVLEALGINCVGGCIGTLYCFVARFQSYGFPSWTQQYKVPMTKTRNLDEASELKRVRDTVRSSEQPRSGWRDAVPGDRRSLCLFVGTSWEIPCSLAHTREKIGNSDEVLGRLSSRGLSQGLSWLLFCKEWGGFFQGGFVPPDSHWAYVEFWHEQSNEFIDAVEDEAKRIAEKLGVLYGGLR